MSNYSHKQISMFDIPEFEPKNDSEVKSVSSKGEDDGRKNDSLENFSQKKYKE